MLIYNIGTDQVLHHRADGEKRGIQVIISGGKQSHNGTDVDHGVGDGAGAAVDILPLHGRQQRRLVSAEEIAEHRLSQRQQVDDVKIQLRRNIAVDQASQEGHQRQSHCQDKAADKPVDGSVKLQQRRDGGFVILRHRSVHGVDHGAAHAQLRQAQHRQDRREQIAQAQILRPQSLDHDGADHKGHQQSHQSVHGCEKNVSYGITRSVSHGSP